MLSNKCNIFLWISLLPLMVMAQRPMIPTDSLKVEGKVKKTMVITMAMLDTMASQPIKDQVIYNHKGEAKDTLTKLQGVKLKTVLSSVDYDYAKPRELNQFCFVLIASDGYLVVLSWNEIYNTETGNHFFLITSCNGKPMKDQTQRIAFLSDADLQTGRRYIKNLERIEVRKVESAE